MQLSMTAKESEKYSKNLVQTLKLIYEEHGVSKGLYRGMSINYIRSDIVNIDFSWFENIKDKFY